MQFDPEAKPFYPDGYTGHTGNPDNFKDQKRIRNTILYLLRPHSQFVDENRLLGNYVHLARVLRTRRLRPYTIELLLDVVHDLVFLEKKLEYDETRLLIRYVS